MTIAEADYKLGLKLDRSPSKIMRFSAFFVRGGRVIQEGIAVDTLLAGAGWNPAMLFQTEFGNT
ncbi:hypothetical protein [Shewanella holmiensis]|uniref:Uncharacterized protein n=1 Tax=Shewanella holmiensis TaxID=2952222 RepID=A0A9X2WR14_9GAMM|nr:hypothetical protein [Shewanella holmiensis]MCT7943694.1 hypothetical protein [Shewanella holmiensis]